MKKMLLFFMLWLLSTPLWASYILIPMDETQKNHLKSYGIAYWILERDLEVTWLLNYRGGSFMCVYHQHIAEECAIRGVSIQVIADVQADMILQEISSPAVNQDAVKLLTAPKMAVYSPKSKLPWDDAVTLVLSYAEIPYDVIYDEEVIQGALPMYDWLHLHHEDFTGQYGKFWANYSNASWYKQEVAQNEHMAQQLGYAKVSQMKLAVVQRIRDFVAGGGFMFAMCSAPDSFDIALAAAETDICDVMFDGDPIDPDCQEKLQYDNCFAFKNFTLNKNPYEYKKSDIDLSQTRKISSKADFFKLFDFSAKWDPIPTILCQNHTNLIKGFMGQTTAFNRDLVKSNVLILGENRAINEVRYLHGEYANGTWTFLGGHDPEDYQHFVGDPPTDLSLHPNSPGYRLILNNVLFPVAKKRKQKT